MSDDTPHEVPEAPAEPFGQPPGGAAPPRKPILIGCGIGCSVLALLVLLLLAALGSRGGEMFRRSLEMSQQALLAAAPDDWTEEDSERLRAAVRGVGEAVSEQRADLVALEALRSRLIDALLKAGRQELSRQDLLDLVDALEAVAAPRPQRREQFVHRMGLAWAA